MGKKISFDQLQGEIDKILKEYEKDAAESIDQAATQIGKAAVSELKSASPVGATGRYSKGWAYEKNRSRLGTSVTVYNKTDGSLTHLLENGHALRQGGRAPGKKHIAPVNDEATEKFEKEVIKKLENL